MEYVVVRATHPSWLTMQLPTEVAQMIQFSTPAKDAEPAGRSISFLARGSGVARVIATQRAREALAVETVRSRMLASARPGDRLIFSLPAQVAEHLGLHVYSRGSKVRGTDDSVVWFLPAPEYYAFRTAVELDRAWPGPSGAALAHVYLAKSTLPLPFRPDELAELEERIEQEEWKPGVAALQRVARTPRAGVGTTPRSGAD
jgi:hypothetical protein